MCMLCKYVCEFGSIEMSDGERRRRKRSLFVFVFGAENIKLRLSKNKLIQKSNATLFQKNNIAQNLISSSTVPPPSLILFTVIHCIEYHLIFLVIPHIPLLIYDIFNYSCRILETPDC